MNGPATDTGWREAPPAEFPAGSPGTPALAIVSALPEELRGLTSRAVVTRPEQRDGIRVIRGRLAGRDLILAATGDGPENAASGVRRLLEAFRPRRLLVVGTAGGLSPGLSPGQVVVARRVLDAKGPAPAPDPAWVDQLGAVLGAPESLFLSSRDVLSSAAAKAAAFHALRWGDGVAVVDLETATYAREAARHGVAYAAVRAVLDPAEESLPFEVNRFRDRRGGVSRWRIAAWAATRPGMIPSLLRLRRRLAASVEALAAALTREGGL